MLFLFVDDELVAYMSDMEIVELIEIIDKLLDAGLARCDEMQAIAHQGVVAYLDIDVIPSAQFPYHVDERNIVEIEIAVLPLRVAFRIDCGDGDFLFLIVFCILSWLEHYLLAFCIDCH